MSNNAKKRPPQMLAIKFLYAFLIQYITKNKNLIQSVYNSLNVVTLKLCNNLINICKIYAIILLNCYISEKSKQKGINMLFYNYNLGGCNGIHRY